MNFTHYLGVPGTGKTTLMRGKLADLRKVEEDEWVKDGYVTFHKFAKQKVLVLGRYDEGTFSGTDTWAKTAGPRFRQWVLDNAETFAGWQVFSEGERLSNNPTLDALFAMGNSESWMKGMRTRIENLCAKYPHTVQEA